MTSSASVPNAGLGASTFKSVPDMWLHRCHSTPAGDAMCYRQAGAWVTMTWREAETAAREVANGLIAAGVESEQRCCILAATSPEWILVDMGILCAGAATTTIFPSSTCEECEYILKDCEAVVVFCDAEQLPKLQEVRERLTMVRQVVVLQGTQSEDDWVQTLDQLREEGRVFAEHNPDAYATAHMDISPDSLATLMYTSGTTGEPKGVMLSHDAWVYEAAAVDAMGLVSPADKQFLFLPLSHVFAKVMQVIFIRLGVPTVVDGDTDALLDNMAATRPTWMGAVPAVFEKAWYRILAQAREGGRARQQLFKWAVGVGREVSRLRQERQEPTGLLRLRYALADRLVFRKVKELFGGRIRFFVSGAAPLPREIAEFFHACDLLILEGYGLTESCAASCFNAPEDFVFGTVGKPLPGTDIRIDEDGEILLSGRGVMQGYYLRPEDTEQALFTDDQDRTWLRTGDIGTQLPSGHVRITDRKKEIIITSGGKNIAPARFQNLLKGRSPYVSHVLLHGDHRPYCVALIVIDEEHVGRWARAQGIEATGYPNLAARPEVEALIQAEVDAVNAELASHATVRKIALLPEPFTVADGSLTPSLKVKRRVVEERYRHILDAFYEGTAR
ncbi:MAG: long-chain fatty acid--CoA ligase [Deltaproteobacteria bacterium]|nr:long-chain fatty acid--CoA ligase [Deltaproteobacteria bacterium]